MFIASLALCGCSAIYDGIMWAPRKIWSVTGDKLVGFHNPQDTNMGPRRRPIANPQGGESGTSYSSPPRGAMGIEPAFPKTSTMPQSNNYNYSTQGDAQSPYPAEVKVMNPQGRGQPNSGMGSNYPSLSGGSYSNMATPKMPGQPEETSGAIPIPAMPPEYKQSYTAGNAAGLQVMPDNFIAPPDLGAGIGDEGISAEAAYAQGGGGSQRKGWSLPFFSGKYKIEARFEPLAEEFVVSENFVNRAPGMDEPSNLNVAATPKKTLQKDSDPGAYDSVSKEKAKRASSMFPLEQYAPKATAEVSTIGNAADDAGKHDNSYPKLGHIPPNPSDATDPKSSASELNAMSKEAEDMQAGKGNLAKQTGTRLDNTKYPDMKVNDSPEKLPEKNNKTDAHSSMWDKVPLARRRDAPKSAKASANNSGALASGALQGDAAIMQELAPDKKTSEQHEGSSPEHKGFFARLHDKLFPPAAPKQIWRKSAPPSGENINGVVN